MLDSKARMILKVIGSAGVGFLLAGWLSTHLPMEGLEPIWQVASFIAQFGAGMFSSIAFASLIEEKILSKSPKRDFHIVTDDEAEDYDDKEYVYGEEENEYSDEYDDDYEENNVIDLCAKQKIESSIKAVEDPELYKLWIKTIVDAGYLDSLGDASKLNWDVNFLANVATTIVMLYDKEILERTGNICSLATELIAQAGAFALLNNSKEVGRKEILGMFEYWKGYLTEDEKHTAFDIIIQVAKKEEEYLQRQKNLPEKKKEERPIETSTNEEEPKCRILKFPKK